MGTNIARLKALTGELIEIKFLIDPYLKGTEFISAPGSGGAWSTKATHITISLEIPSNRPLPEDVLVKLYAEPAKDNNDEGSSLEFQLTLEFAGERLFSGQFDFPLIILSGKSGNTFSKKQLIKFVLITNSHEETLTDPVNGSNEFQLDLYQATISM